MKEKHFKLITHGCRTNQYESQAYADQLRSLGYKPASEDTNVDICIVNTCTVTESADASSRASIRQLKQKYPWAKLVITGCYAERVLAEVEGLEDSLIVLNKDKEKLIEKVFPEEKTFPEFNIKRFEAHTRAFVKVQDGCNSFCSYCIIPYVRGRSYSRRIEDIVKEVEGLIANGYKEVVLTGINIGDFDGGNKQHTLADLVKVVDAIPGLKRLRVSSIDPDEVDEALLSAIITGENTCHSMHVVLQSGSNAILKRMNRKYTKAEFLSTVERLKQASSDFTFTTDIIVGFPGETDADFEETLEVMKTVRFTKVHMFPYSERKRTKASTFSGKVSSDLIQKRKQEVLRLSENLAFELRQEYIGRVLPVLMEGKEDNGFQCGHTENFLNVEVQSSQLKPNDIVNVQLIENTPFGLRGVLV